MNRELRDGLIDALYYADRALIRITNSDNYLQMSPDEPLRATVGALSRVISSLMEHLIRYEENQ